MVAMKRLGVSTRNCCVVKIYLVINNILLEKF